MVATEDTAPGVPAGRRPSVKDVAQRAGVSWKTVSNVVNGRTNVRPATRERVEQAIQELGYRTSLAGRQLRSGRTHLLAVALPELTTPYFAGLAHEIIGQADQRGYTVLISETNGRAEAEGHVAHGFDTQFADGIILNPVALDSASVLEAHGPIPLVLLGERVDGSHVDHVIIDNEASGREATMHLIELGRRSIVFIGTDSQQQFGTGWLRMCGYQQGLREAGLPLNTANIVAVEEFTRDAGAKAVQHLVDRGTTFDGLVCASDLLAIGAMYALRCNGLAVPDDVAVIGWDDTPEGSYANPTLSTIALDAASIAKHAVDLVIRRIEEPGASPAEVVAGHALIERESTTGVAPGL